MKAKNPEAENSKSASDMVIQPNIAPCCMKKRVYFFSNLDFTTYRRGGNCIDIDVEQMAGVVKNSTLKTHLVKKLLYITTYCVGFQ